MASHAQALPGTVTRVVVAALAALFGITGCYTSHVRTPYAGAGDVQEHLSVETAPAFTYEKSDVPFTNHV
ncbi:MAG: hypothetical protein IFK92_16355, partial [Acidobacteria bacterium]|nr:hypothetical protein [Candidatus Sulfomarinibacter kjeldsenii]